MPNDPAHYRANPGGDPTAFVELRGGDEPDDVQAIVDPTSVVAVVNGSGAQVDVVTTAGRVHLYGIPFADVLAALGIAPVPPTPHTRQRYPRGGDRCGECSAAAGHEVYWSAATDADPERHPSRPSTVSP